MHDAHYSGAAAAPPRWMVVCLVVALLAVVYASFKVYFELPYVYYDSGTKKPVACAHEGTGWKETPASDPLCSEALEGKGRQVWVAPGWKPAKPKERETQ